MRERKKLMLTTLTTSTSCEKVMAVTNKQRLKVELTEIEI